MKLGQPSLDQLRIFVAVAEEGSFNAAAKRMGRAISAISYGVAQLEGQLALTLFDREGSRRPVLTEAGRALLAEARSVLDRSDGLLAKAQSLHQGLEAELSLALDVMLPGEVIAQVLRDFATMFPTVALRLHIEALGAVAACVLDGDAGLAVAGPTIGEDPALERQVIGSVELVPVASPGHRLAKGRAEPGASREHLQLVLTDRSPLTEGREFAVLSPRSWRLADLSAKHALLREGIGWGNMPRHMVADDLAAGRLVLLDLPESPGADYSLTALWRRDMLLGPAASWMVDALQARLGECEGVEPSARGRG
ncbi:MAG: LysR family transcriptional regulator [Sphingomonadaceae bacterium]|nr:LysR family transcriptional regulator [Sphingomonadaceae bacterium]